MEAGTLTTLKYLDESPGSIFKRRGMVDILCPDAGLNLTLWTSRCLRRYCMTCCVLPVVCFCLVYRHIWWSAQLKGYGPTPWMLKVYGPIIYCMTPWVTPKSLANLDKLHTLLTKSIRYIVNSWGSTKAPYWLQLPNFKILQSLFSFVNKSSNHNTFITLNHICWVNATTLWDLFCRSNYATPIRFPIFIL